MDLDGSATWDSGSAISFVLFPMECIHQQYFNLLMELGVFVYSLFTNSIAHMEKTSEQTKLCSSQRQKVSGRLFCLQKCVFTSSMQYDQLTLEKSKMYVYLNSTSQQTCKHGLTTTNAGPSKQHWHKSSKAVFTQGDKRHGWSMMHAPKQATYLQRIRWRPYILLHMGCVFHTAIFDLIY